MCIRLAEVGRPGVDMRIEVNESQLPAEPPRQGSEQGERDPVLAAERNKVPGRRCLLLDQAEALWNVAECEAEIPHIGEVEHCRFDPELRMFTIHQHATGTSNGVWSIARACSIRRADVERNACNNEIRRVVMQFDPEKTRW